MPAPLRVGTARALVGAIMKLSTLALFALALLFFIGTPSEAEAGKRLRTRSCTPEAEQNIAEAVDFLNQNLGQLQNAPVSFGNRRPHRRRVKRRMGRRFNKLSYDCATDDICPVLSWRTGQHKGGIVGRKIHLCYENMVARNFDFCYFTSVIAHEFGHASGIEIDRDFHNDSSKDHSEDPVYKFGFFAQRLCKDAGLNRAIESRKKKRRGW